jgi:large subunit ribosomal protein L13
MRTFSTKPSDVRRQWHVIDATNQPLGRLASQAAVYLRGKHKPIYAPHLDTGDFVIVVNAAKVRLSGRKVEQKRYYRHSGYPGGLHVRDVKHELAARPERVIERAVRGMLPKGPLGLHLFHHLKVYRGPAHPHAAQTNAPPPTAFAPGAPASNTPHAPLASAVSVRSASEALLPAAEPELALPEPDSEKERS